MGNVRGWRGAVFGLTVGGLLAVVACSHETSDQPVSKPEDADALLDDLLSDHPPAEANDLTKMVAAALTPEEQDQLVHFDFGAATGRSLLNDPVILKALRAVGNTSAASTVHAQGLTPVLRLSPHDTTYSCDATCSDCQDALNEAIQELQARILAKIGGPATTCLGAVAFVSVIPIAALTWCAIWLTFLHQRELTNLTKLHLCSLMGSGVVTTKTFSSLGDFNASCESNPADAGPTCLDVTCPTGQECLHCGTGETQNFYQCIDPGSFQCCNGAYVPADQVASNPDCSTAGTDGGTCGAPARGACNTVTSKSAPITPTCVPDPPPTLTGGTIQDGTYVLTTLEHYNAQNCSTAPYAQTLEIAGGCVKQFETDQPANVNYALTPSGNALNPTITCPPNTPVEYTLTYTATPSTLVVRQDKISDTSIVAVLTYQKL